MKYIVSDGFKGDDLRKSGVLWSTKEEAIAVAISWNSKKAIAIIQKTEPGENADFWHVFVGAVVDGVFKPANILKSDAIKAIRPFADFSDVIFGGNTAEAHDFEEVYHTLKFVMTNGVWKDDDVPSRS